ncbi:MAG: hypothetical protein ABI559_01445 [Chloroflexota bacterium]
MTNRLRYLLAVLALALVAVSLAACGGDDGPTATPVSTKGRAVIQVAVTPPIPDNVMTNLQAVLKARLDDAGLTSTITLASDNQIRIDFEGPRSINVVTELVSTPGVRFKVPVKDGTLIKCKDTSGGEFSVDPAIVTQFQQVGNLPVCVATDGRRGEVEWAPAAASLNSVQTELIGDMIPKTHVAIVADSNGNQILNADFDANGTVLLQQITADLVGYPLGVFLGDSLQLAALIQRQITNGRITLAGASLEGMEELGSILKGGELSAPVTLVSIEKQ